MKTSRDLLFTLYMGGPDSIDAIRPFLFNLFSDRTIIDFGIGAAPQRLLARLIAKRRAKKVAPEYAKMGGASPQLPHLNSLLKKVAPRYESLTGRALDTTVGMCYWHPFIEEAVALTSRSGYDNVIVMTMYPQYSFTTAGVCFARFNQAINTAPPEAPMTVINAWHTFEPYVDCMVRRILDAATTLGKPIDQCHILFSAHSLPEKTVGQGDPYTEHLNEQIRMIIEKTAPGSFGLAYQSRTGPVKWLGPETSDEIDRLHATGVNDVIVVPLSFVSDHIETLIELDEGYIHDARQKGMRIVRAASLNDADDFADALTRLITD